MSVWGRALRISTFGESHCASVGCVVDGLPPGLPLVEMDIQVQLSRRRPGQSAVTTARDEKDRVRIVSGTESGITLGSPIAMLVQNEDQRPGDYAAMNSIPRPSHADMTYMAKYGVKASSGGGRASARETIGRVAAGAAAEKFLRLAYGIEIIAWVSGVGSVRLAPEFEAQLSQTISRDSVDASSVRCPDASTAAEMTSVIDSVRAASDSVGGIVSCVCRGVPAGWGEPCFDKLEAELAHAMLSIPATKGFEIGSGFAGAAMTGSSHNDPFEYREGRLRTTTNRSGGVQGGISNGEDIFFRVAFKPPATIGRAQQTAAFDGTPVVLEAKGRHDPCVVPRAVPIVEAMAALVLADAALLQLGRESASLLVGKSI